MLHACYLQSLQGVSVLRMTFQFMRSENIHKGAKIQCTHTEPQQPLLFLREPVNPVTFEWHTFRDMMKDVTVRSCLEKFVQRYWATAWLISKALKESISAALTTNSSRSSGGLTVKRCGINRDNALDGRNFCKTSAVVAIPNTSTIGISAAHSLQKYQFSVNSCWMKDGKPNIQGETKS